jgi:predicted short-subunit dehydrogenase-like oxidoreductase (DUF2520 family)
VNITIVGAGRAGTSFFRALRDAGHLVDLVHHDDAVSLTTTDLVLLTVPDDAIARTAASLPRSARYVVAHVAGSRGLNELQGHERIGSMHPLAALPNGEIGAPRLRGALYSIAGDALIAGVVASLSGRALRLSDAERVNYHATATVAANHLVALMGHVEVLAASAGMTLEDFLPLVHQSLADVERVGVSAALTGPASRADMATIDAHLDAIPESQRSTYVAMANAAFELAEQRRSTSRV